MPHPCEHAVRAVIAGLGGGAPISGAAVLLMVALTGARQPARAVIRHTPHGSTGE